MVYVPKCQAHNRAQCRDPKCPEKQGFRNAYLQAARNNDYNSYAKVRNLENERNKQQEEKLFHTEIGFPRNFTPPQGLRKLEYGSHAKREAKNDRYGTIQLPATLNLDEYKLIEIGVTTQNGRNKVEKMLYRGKLDSERDLCIVVIPSGNKHEPWFVKTVWVNETSDLHRTLNPKKYINPYATQKVAA